jgi:hypothetical protein
MKKINLLAVACYLAIPFVIVGGLFVAGNINPEWALRTANYSRNFHLLTALKAALFFSSVGLGGVLWFLTCYCLVRAKRRSGVWLAFAFLGPFGFSVLAALRDGAPSPGDAWQRLVQRMGRSTHIAHELIFFFAAWSVSYQAMALLRNNLILRESLATGATVAQIVAQRNTMGGMYSFAEGIKVMYLVPLIYLSWPIAFNLLARLRGRR